MKDNLNAQKTTKNSKIVLYSIIIGSVTGIVNGLFGGGGGMILVPALTFFLKKQPKIAHATALLIILPMSIVSSILYASFGNFDTSIGVPVIVGTTVGGAVGSIILPKLSSKIVVVSFAIVMIIAGGKMLFF